MNHLTLAVRLLATCLLSSSHRTTAIGKKTAIGLVACLTLGFFSSGAHAQIYTLKTLHSFTGGATDGASPQAGLCNVNGVIYGTTYAGGSAGVGTIFSYNPATNTETTVYTFGVATGDGANPWAALLNVNGILYGTTAFGGSNTGLNGNGIVFSFNPATKTETILHTFQGGTDGAYPQGTLIDVNGQLYGTTASGNTSYGNIYVINPDGMGYQSLYDFQDDGITGLNPVAGLVNVNGMLIGSTYYGPTNGGTLFSYTPSSGPFYTYTYFTGGSNGAHPRFEMTNFNGVLYGTTTGNGDDNGTIFSINPIGTGFQTLYDFAGGSSDGATPYTTLVAVNSMLFGTTEAGGTSNNGTIFAFDTTTNTERLVYSFSGTSDGAAPQSGLILVNGKYYGTTSAGGAAGDGTLYSFKIVTTVPTANDDSYQGSYKMPITMPAPGVLGNDTNGSTGPFKAVLVSGPANGTLTLKANGSFTYVPTGTFAGTDSFTYQDTNSVGTSNVATVTLTITPVAPTAINDSYNVTKNTRFTISTPGVLGNDDNGGDAPLTAIRGATTSHGTLTLKQNGGFVYTPAAGFTGTDSFSYQAENSIGKSNLATVTLTVQ